MCSVVHKEKKEARVGGVAWSGADGGVRKGVVARPGGPCRPQSRSKSISTGHE